LELPQNDVLQWVNEPLKDRRAYLLTPKSFARVRRECGFQDGVNVIKRRRERGRRFLIFDSSVRSALGVEPTNDEVAEAAGLAPSRESFETERVRGAKNIMAISDRTRTVLKWNPDKDDSWVARSVLLALQLPEDSQPDLEALVAAMRKEMNT
jgi:ribosomal protein L34